MRRHLMLLLLCLWILGLTACNKTEELPQETTTKSEEEITREIIEEGLNEDGTIKGVDVGDRIKKLADYKEMKIPRDEIKVTDKELDEQIDLILSEYTKIKKVRKRKIKKGDIVRLSYDVKVDGKIIPEETARKREIVIGSGVFKELEEGIIGKKPGKITVHYTLPDPYEYDESLSGKEAVIKAKVRYILEAKKPKLNNEFVKKEMEPIYHVSTVKKWKKALRRKLRRQKKGQYVMTTLHNKTKFKRMPRKLVDACLDRYVLHMKNTAKANGISFQDYLKQAHYANEEAMRESARSMCREEARICILVDEIASRENITVEEKDLEELLTNGEVTLEKLKEYYPVCYLNRQALNLKVRDYIVDHSKVKK